MRERLSCAVLNLDTLQTQPHTFHIPILRAGTEDALISSELQSSHRTLYSEDLRFVDAYYITGIVMMRSHWSVRYSSGDDISIDLHYRNLYAQ